MQPGFEVRTHRESSQAADLKGGVEASVRLIARTEKSKQDRNHKGIQGLREGGGVLRQGFQRLPDVWPLRVQVPACSVKGQISKALSIVCGMLRRRCTMAISLIR